MQCLLKNNLTNTGDYQTLFLSVAFLNHLISNEKYNGLCLVLESVTLCVIVKKKTEHSEAHVAFESK